MQALPILPTHRGFVPLDVVYKPRNIHIGLEMPDKFFRAVVVIKKNKSHLVVIALFKLNGFSTEVVYE